VGDPNAINDGSQRSRVEPDDEDDDDDMEPDGVLKAAITGTRPDDAITENLPDLTSVLARSVCGYLAETRQEVRHSLGSNNWAVS